MQVTWQPQYDYGLVTRETDAIQFFKAPLGFLDNVTKLKKTFEQTNGNQPASTGLPYPNPFTVMGISMCPDWGVDSEGLNEYVNHSYVRIYRNKYDLQVIPAKLVFSRSEQQYGDKAIYAISDVTLSKNEPFGVEVITSYRTISRESYAPWGYHCVLTGYFTSI